MSMLCGGATAKAVLRAALTVSAAGAALSVGAASAVADAASDTVKLVGGPVLTSTDNAVRPVTEMQLNPLAKTGVDPLNNGVSTQVADFKPLSTRPLTKPLSDGDSFSQLPVVGRAAQLATRL